MFQPTRNALGAGVLLTALALGSSSCSPSDNASETSTENTVDFSSERALGSVGYGKIELVEKDGLSLLVYDNYHSVSVIEHSPDPKNLESEFHVTRLGDSMHSNLYKVSFQGEDYVCADNYHGCEIRLIGK